ncbi:hypothetical protein WOLCODRAFT_135884 [Wolfiporia cocos MD-104 SS10]|uniref:WD40 repeat-like protein n=1 Tax=Wolfiporia cocos (strain MD-104) TaxID=742152 RepID=A0A2H3J6I1_WOLCO|nr:hypothetical protein WOLCODRAFT_135884 [Wolfiporia cocos MD-104 SS10]
MSLQSSFNLPSAITALTIVDDDGLCVGSEDGCLRLYHLPSPRVVRAVKSIGSEISSIVSHQSKKSETSAIWLASGQRAYSFPSKADKLIIAPEDATASVTLGEDEEDVLNELSISDNGQYLAFSTDGGSAGVIELSTVKVTRMKTRHSNICGSVKFIPGRPSELVSGGYDSALLHYDFAQGRTLSRYDITAAPPSSGISLSPPFILSTAISPTALFAAGTADGRVWLGGGGEKRASSAKKKRSRKWEGLKEDEGVWMQVAEGPIVAVAFCGMSTLYTCTLLGTLARYQISRNEGGNLHSERTWSAEAKAIEKVNAISINEKWLVVGGLDKAGKGVAEVWDVTSLTQIENA